MKDREMYTPFKQILHTKDWLVNYEPTTDGRIRLKDHSYPLSIKEDVFNYITRIIKRYNLQRGLEIGTGTGVSALAAALGFIVTGGKLVTIDSYMEERGDGTFTKKPDGYLSTIQLKEAAGVEDALIPVEGWSPDDVGSIVTRHFGTEKLDYVFLDGGPFEDQIIDDIEAVLPYLSDKFVFLFHDVSPTAYTQKVLDYISEKLGKEMNVIRNSEDGLWLGVVITTHPDIKFISYQGQVSGQLHPDNVDSPDIIDAAIADGFDVMVDVWFGSGQWYLGSSGPKTMIDTSWLVERRDKLWLRVCDHQALSELRSYGDMFNYFWYDFNGYTLTSHGFILSSSRRYVLPESIWMNPERTTDTSNPNIIDMECVGICSRDIAIIKELFVA